MKGGIAQLVQLTLVSPSVSAAALPEDIQELIQQHGNLVQEPKTLPPHRQGDHSIPLLEGVQPVNIKPYRYNPMQKDEIER